jgi:hypothetical protein
MNAAPVLIVAFAGDMHAAAVAELLKRRNVPVEWIDTADLNKNLRLNCSLNGVAAATLTLTGGRRVSLADFGTIWWRRPRRPVSESTVDDTTREFLRSEWEHFLGGLESFTEARWVNPPGASYLANRKGLQLVTANVVGLRVPRTAITNDPDAVRALAGEGAPLIYKRLGATARPVMITRELLPGDLDRLSSLTSCPAIFQERIDARLDIRVTAMGDRLHAAEIDSQSGDAPLDWRLDHSVAMRPHTLDAQTAACLRALMRRLGLLYGAIDLRLTPEGEYVFLEVNPSGQFLFLELVAGMPLSEYMADFLAGEEGPALDTNCVSVS